MQKFLKQNKNSHQVLNLSKGFTLVETLVAISIFTMSLLGIMSVLASNITNVSYARQKMTAIYLAQEGIEYARNVRDTDAITNGGSSGWSTFTNPSLTPIAAITPTAPSDRLYTRTISRSPANPTGSNVVTITSTVSWTQGSGPKTVTFSENLYNWIE